MKSRASVSTIVAWSWFGLLAVLGTYLVVARISEAPTLIDAQTLVSALLYGCVGAILMTVRPESVIGLLLLVEATAYSVSPDQILAATTTTPQVTGGLAPLVLLGGAWGAMYLVPILLLLLLFPTGRPPGPRWRWLYRADLAFAVVTVLLVLTSPRWESLGGLYVAENPLAGALPLPSAAIQARLDPFLAPAYGGTLVALVLLSVLSLLVRYRGAGRIERAQIRWLLFAGALYAIALVTSIATGAFTSETLLSLPRLMFALGFVSIPVAILLAILRHRLFDIDVIIRKTLQYGVLTAILGGLYAGSVLLVQVALEPFVGGADSPPVVVVTTLALAALFNPLRSRVQRVIDRRFYRDKLGAERALARFATFARDEVDLEALRTALFGTVAETLRPESMGLWLQPPPRRRPRGDSR